MMNLDRTNTPAGDDYATVYVAFELSKAKWRLGIILPGARKMSRYTIDGGDTAGLSARLSQARAKAASYGKPVRILSCYEAGFDGHWLHRWLMDQGVISYEVDPSSIEVNRRARRAKTDRIDLDKLMRTFLAYVRGEPRVCSMLHVPTVEDEDRKRLTRERERLLKERTAHSNRIKGLLHAHGIRDAMPMKRGFIESLATVRTGDGRPLSRWVKEEITREHERLCLVEKHICALEKTNTAELRAAAPGSAEAKVIQLADLKGIGLTSGQKLVNEVFYRSFDNRRQVGSCFRADRHAVSQRHKPARPRHQQSRQPAGSRARRRTRLAVDHSSARQRTDALVPRARGQDQGPHPAHRHCSARAQTDGSAVALSNDRRSACGRRAASSLLNSRGQ